MIKQLILENVSFFESASIEFSDNFNVITGETGAGKTLLVSTLLTLTGEKVEIELLDKAKPGSITGIFELSESVIEELSSIELDVENPVIVRRSFKKEGKSLTYLNDTPISSQVLKKIGALLFDIHGQHEHQLLLKKEHHIKVIDIMAQNDALLAKYREQKDEYESFRKKYFELIKRMEDAQKEREILEFTYRELEDAKLSEINEEELVNSLREMESAEEIKVLISDSLGAFSSEDGPSINVFLTQLKKNVADVLKRTSRAQSLSKQLAEVTTLTSEFEASLEAFGESIVYDEEQLASGRRIYDNLETLKKKYRTDLAGLMALHEKTKEQMNLIENPELSLAYIKSSMEESLLKLKDIASELHERREKTSSRFEKKVNKSLKQLNMPDSEIKVAIEYSAETIFDNGFDSLEMFLSNRFAPEGMPLRKIASGGEISRVMLAAKGALNESDPVGTMIFDEIDQGISGETAVMVAESMADASKSKQIIAITHLPQIAAKGERHIYVSKEKKFISAEVIEGKDRVNEIARLLGSSLSPETAEKHARALLKG